MKPEFKRIFVIVLDSLGIGAADDAESFGDSGADTLGHIIATVGELHIPNLERLGLLRVHDLKNDCDNHLDSTSTADMHPIGSCALYLREASNGKDTMTGHWEMMGLKVTRPFLTFSENGFPEELIRELEERTGRKIIGNKSCSGTAILDELAEQEIGENKLIVYTSADSVLQICGNEDTMGLETLYHYCEIARELTLRPEWQVGRVIARPYKGLKRGEFKRTSNRRDLALKPFKRTVLDLLEASGRDCIGVGKIHDIFDGEGITESLHSDSSVHGMEQTIELQKRDFTGLCFTNLVDFDALWGHRRDPYGYANELERFDEKLGEFLANMRDDDLLMITADHGNDPTYRGTDHTREDVPLLIASPKVRGGRILPPGDTFGCIGATVLDNFDIPDTEGLIGTSLLAFLPENR